MKIIKKEIIGKQVSILYNNKVYDGLVIDETKNLFFIKTKEGTKKIIKKDSKIKIQGQTIQGSKLNKNPIDRIKSD